MGGDQCQNLQFFLYSYLHGKVLMTRSLLFACEVLHTNDTLICMVKFYIQMTRSLLFACEVLHTNDTLICMVKFYIQMILSFAW